MQSNCDSYNGNISNGWLQYNTQGGKSRQPHNSNQYTADSLGTHEKAQELVNQIKFNVANQKVTYSGSASNSNPHSSISPKANSTGVPVHPGLGEESLHLINRLLIKVVWCFQNTSLKIINYPENTIIIELSSTDVAVAVVVLMKITITLHHSITVGSKPLTDPSQVKEYIVPT